jgi:FkbM family methyltransferase
MPHIRHLVRAALPRNVKRQYYSRLLANWIPEPDSLICRDYVKPGDSVLDIGANIGTYTKLLSDLVGINGYVYSFEPIPETFDYLQHNVGGLRNVGVYPFAVSAHSGRAYMRIPAGNFYQAHLSQSGIGVRLVALDDFVDSIPPSFIKCDVEGHELEVIRGAQKLIQRCHPTWLMEISSPESTSAMKSFGYVATKLHVNWLFVYPHAGSSSRD